MDEANMNTIVAKELSEALARCQQQGVDVSTVRTGLLTITIANFVNGIGMEGTVSLFSALPEQIRSGLFNKFVNPVHASQTMPNAPSYSGQMVSNTEYKRRRL
ncbi:MAG: hypothetical protein NXI13_09970 [Proteobacteria bacterium]|nr:hypothetical protein [Pseudomonadota bacterium]